MPKKIFQNVTHDALDQVKKLTVNVEKNSLAFQKAKINAESPFSTVINNAFSGYDEFSYLMSLRLREAKVTRVSLVREIDFDLYITEKQRTNYELMLQGFAPYAKDDKDSYIILHHIGQAFDAPFAELTEEEHARFGNSKLLHSSSEDSWRRDLRKEKAFMSERCTYWKMRAAKKIEYLSSSNTTKTRSQEVDDKDLTYEIKKTLEVLFSQCTTGDLAYISSLAQSHLLIKELGATTVDEFLENTRLEKEETVRCPSCRGADISFYGSYQTKKESKQKFKCNSCNKIFSSTYNAIIEGCSFSLADWVKFIDCVYNGYSVGKTARLCNISEKAAYKNRVRLFLALMMLEENVKLEGNIAIDETYIPNSLKGNHKSQKGFSMPRPARKRGSENHTAGLSKNQVCIACALDEYGNSIAKVAGFGASSAKRLEEALIDHIDAEQSKLIHSDASPAIRCFANRNQFPVQQSTLKSTVRKKTKNYETVRQIQRINAYHARLKKFLERFNGVSTENLQGYVSLFSWKERNRDRDPIDAYKELLAEMVVPNKYLILLEHIENLPEISGEENKESNRRYFQNAKSEQKTKEIYARYAQGISVKEIAKEFGCSPQAIQRRIRNFRAWGFGYKTQKEIDAEEAAKRCEKADEQMVLKFIELGKYYERLLAEKQAWSGTPEAFYIDAEKRFGRKKQTIKNDISTAKRIADLRESFCAGDEYAYMDLQDVYEKVVSRYGEIRLANANLSNWAIFQQLAKEFGYTAIMISKILSLYKKGRLVGDTKGKTRMPVSQTRNRDRSVFIDYLNWTGTKKEFLAAAAEKYEISSSEIQYILKLNYIADPRRYGMAEID